MPKMPTPKQSAPSASKRAQQIAARRLAPLTQAEKDSLIVRAGVEATTYWLPLERLLDRIKDLGPHSKLGDKPLKIIRAKLRSLACK